MPDGDIFDVHVPRGFRKVCRAIASGQVIGTVEADDEVAALTEWLHERGTSDLPAIVRVVEAFRTRGEASEQAIDEALDRLNDIRAAGGSEATERLVDAGKQELLKQCRAGGRSWLDITARTDYEIGANILVTVADRIMFSPAMQGALMAEGYAKSPEDTQGWRQDLQERLLSSPSFRRLAVHMVENGDCAALKPVAKKRRHKMSQADIIDVSLIQ